MVIVLYTWSFLKQLLVMLYDGHDGLFTTNHNEDVDITWI